MKTIQINLKLIQLKFYLTKARSKKGVAPKHYAFKFSIHQTNLALN